MGLQERAEEILTNFSDIMTEDYQGRMAAKLVLRPSYNAWINILAACIDVDLSVRTFQQKGHAVICGNAIFSRQWVGAVWLSSAVRRVWKRITRM